MIILILMDQCSLNMAVPGMHTQPPVPIFLVKQTPRKNVQHENLHMCMQYRTAFVVQIHVYWAFKNFCWGWTSILHGSSTREHFGFGWLMEEAPSQHLLWLLIFLGRIQGVRIFSIRNAWAEPLGQIRGHHLGLRSSKL